MKTFYCVLLLLCPYIGAAQGPALQSILPGQPVPDIAFNQMLNYKSSSARLYDFKGKLVILDFWASWCSNCLKQFNLLDSLQQQYQGKLQVILVGSPGGRDGKEKTAAYLQKHLNAAGKKYSMPAAINDSVAGRYFPHSSLPYYVWIGPDGNCLALTNSEELTAENISLALAGGKPAFSGLGLMDDFDFEKPLFVQGNAGDGSGLMARSTLSHFIPGMAPMARYSRNAQRLTTQYKLINQPLLQLLIKAYNADVLTDRIVFNVPDSIKQLLLPGSTAQKRANSYTYELLCPPLPHSRALQLVQQDMARYFNLTAAWQPLPASCYALTIDTVKIKPYLGSGGKSINKLYNPENKYLQNGKLKSLAEYLNHSMQHPVLLQTSLPYLLNISLPDKSATGNDDAAVIQALEAMDINLKPVTATIPQFVIYQSPKTLL